MKGEPFTYELALKIGWKMGLKPWETFRLTLYELNILWLAWNEQQTAVYEQQIEITHLNASLNGWAYHEPKKMPELKKLLPRKMAKASAEEDKMMHEQAAAIGMRVPG